MQSINFWSAWIAGYLRARLGRTERGASLVEYLLLVTLIAVVCIAGLMALGGSAQAGLEDSGSRLG